MSEPRRITVTTTTTLEVRGDAPARDLARVYFHNQPRRTTDVWLPGTTARVIGSVLDDYREDEA